MGQGMSASVGPRKLNKKNMQLSMKDTKGNKTKTPGKSYIYRMNSSFSKEGASSKNTTGLTSDENLPTIIKNTSSSSGKDSMVIGLRKRNNKINGGQTVDKLTKQDSVNKSKTSKDSSKVKANLVKKDSSSSQKSKTLPKYFPKLWIDVPMMIDRIKHSDNWYENEGKWIYRCFGREEYQRKEQVKNIDSSSKNSRIIYDNTDRSPFYNDSSVPYYDEKKLIVSKDGDNGSQPNRFKTRGFRRPIINSGVPRKDKIYTELNPYYIVQDKDDHTLLFESRFECGNLKRAIQTHDFEYDLIVQSDYNSQGFSQWFYFRIGNTRAETKYTFNLYNFYKPDALYNQGMKPLMYSTKKAKIEGVGWCRCGDDIWYYQNTTKKKTGTGYLYSLSFSTELPYDNDEVYFAHWFPYSYRDCKEHLDRLCVDNIKGKI